MTIEAELKFMLVNHGLFESMADKVVEAVKADPANASMQGRWSDKRDDYPGVVFAICWMSARSQALKIIDSECPNHWARQVFVNP